ncbi:MAG: hypothetical protein IKO10_12780 [Lachnospiraceae bacterium]|nr:hypothetical protein [Lachnospiraceae bacterium]
MKNRTVMARLAALGMSVMLCFGAVACGEEESDSRGTRTESEKEEDEKETDEKEETSEDKETETDEKEETSEDKETETDKGGSEEKENNSKDEQAEAPKDNTNDAPSVNDGKIEGHYVAVVDLGEDYFMDNMGSEYSEVAEMFRGADFTFSATLDLNEDGTGHLAFDMDEFYQHMYDWMDKNYIDMMKGVFASMGIDDDQLLEMVKGEGYTTVEEALEDMKEDMMKEFDESMRDGGGSKEDMETDLKWEENGTKLDLTADNGNVTSMTIGADGSLTLELDEEDSPTNSAMELVFKKR